MADVTKLYHRHIYPAIAPSNFDFTGKTVLVFGISSIIGQATARAFIRAKAAHVVCVNRNPEALQDAMANLKATLDEKDRSKLSSKRCDMTDAASVDALWKGLEAEGTQIDILVLVAASLNQGPLLKDGALAKTLQTFAINVDGCLRVVDGFVSHPSKGQKVLLNMSTAATHMTGGPAMGQYASSKAAFTLLVQHLASEIPVNEMQIISYHPGAVFSDAAQEAGFTTDTIPWDDADVPGQFAVWAASPRASFLHGRFVWAEWDIEELEQMKSHVEEDDGFLKLGLQGIPTTDFGALFKRIAEKTA